MQDIALARTGRLGIDRDMLAAIYVGLRFYRLTQELDAANSDAMAELGRLLTRGAIPTSPTDLEIAIVKEIADAVAHSHPDSSDAAILKFVAQLAAR
jgi:hypothetical protein